MWDAGLQTRVSVIVCLTHFGKCQPFVENVPRAGLDSAVARRIAFECAGETSKDDANGLGATQALVSATFALSFL